MEPLRALDHVLISIPSDHVLIPVPKTRAAEVTALLERPPAVGAPSRPVPTAADSAAAQRDAAGDALDEEKRRWTPEALGSLIDDDPHPKQMVLLELLAQHAGEPVYADMARKRLEESGLLAHTSYSGKALGGVVLSLKRRARWYEEEVPLFDDGWDRERGMNWYQLPEDHAAPLVEAIAGKRRAGTSL